MTKLARWLPSMVVGMMALTSGLADAQSNITPEQRNAYGKQFKASIPERRMLLEAQESRMAFPNNGKMKEYLDSRPSTKLLAQGLADELGYLMKWNEIALDAVAIDHTNGANLDPAAPPDSDPPSYYAEQFGPPRASRALAIVHLAMFEAVNTISPKYQSYRDLRGKIIAAAGVPADEIARASKNRAIVSAAYHTLIKLYPYKKVYFDNALDVTLKTFPDITSPANVVGDLVGTQAAKAVLHLRHFDGSELPDLSSVNFSSLNPLNWHQDPISKLPPALGGNWFRVKPFLMTSGEALRGVLPGPPDTNSKEFIAAYKQVKRLGGDPNVVPSGGERWPTRTTRTGAADPMVPVPADNTNQTFVGIFWAYDGSSYLCAPPRLYNMIATSVALRERPIGNVEDFALYLAYLNLTMADAAIASWDAKYYFLYPRPVTLIRDLAADNTPEGGRDPEWTPLGGQSTNAPASSRNFTPPFPAYPSGHATFGGALFQGMTLFYKAMDPSFPDDGVPFDFVSDEYNGLNYGAGDKKPRVLVKPHFKSFKEAEKLNADSRIYLGVHWSFDADDGVKLGNAVSRDNFARFVKPLPSKPAKP